MDKQRKQTVIQDFGRTEGDVGSPEVQIAVLTERIKEVTEHLRYHKKDHSSRRGLRAMVDRRRKLLDYLDRTVHDRYVELIQRLNLRR
ncbi:MAG: 30S ribosomal protein S15 [Candidatus Pacebacteria bacterium]|nr:30S ribosomal protein S15 [Candidatus Paceibacterota bacterium]